MKKVLRLILGLALFSFALTILYLSMRAIMAIGGSCAEGGPYVIQNHCPGGTGYLTPLSIFVMMGGAVLYFSGLVKNSPNWGVLFWSALFLSLGWNFLDFSIHPPSGSGIDIGWIICAIMFGLMGIAPLPFLAEGLDAGEITKNTTWSQILFGQNKKDPQNPGISTKFYESQIFLLISHLIAVSGGMYLGYLVFMNS
jgi:hypothetical protein